MSSGTPTPNPSNSSAAVAATPAHVTSTPIAIRRATVRRTSGAMSRSDSRRPASKRTTPTATETNGW